MSVLFAVAFYLGLISGIGLLVTWIILKTKKHSKTKMIRNLFFVALASTFICFIGYGTSMFLESVIDSAEEDVQAASTKSETKDAANEVSSTEVKSTTEKPQKEDNTEQLYKIGEATMLNDVSYTVTNAVAKDTVAGYTSESGTFLIVDISIQNNSNKAITVNNSHFKVLLGDIEYENHSNTTAYHEGGFFLKEVNPGLSTSNSIVFEVPKDYANAQLFIEPNIFKDEVATIDLQ